MCQRKHVRRNSARCLYTFSGGMGRCPPPDGHFDHCVYFDDRDEDDFCLFESPPQNWKIGNFSDLSLNPIINFPPNEVISAMNEIIETCYQDRQEFS